MSRSEVEIYKRKQEKKESYSCFLCFLGRVRLFFLFFLIAFLVESVFSCSLTFLFSFIFHLRNPPLPNKQGQEKNRPKTYRLTKIVKFIHGVARLLNFLRDLGKKLKQK